MEGRSEALSIIVSQSASQQLDDLLRVHLKREGGRRRVIAMMPFPSSSPNWVILTITLPRGDQKRSRLLPFPHFSTNLDSPQFYLLLHLLFCPFA
jgi:hypothetical protein